MNIDFEHYHVTKAKLIKLIESTDEKYEEAGSEANSIMISIENNMKQQIERIVANNVDMLFRVRSLLKAEMKSDVQEEKN